VQLFALRDLSAAAGCEVALPEHELLSTPFGAPRRSAEGWAHADEELLAAIDEARAHVRQPGPTTLRAREATMSKIEGCPAAYVRALRDGALDPEAPWVSRRPEPPAASCGSSSGCPEPDVEQSEELSQLTQDTTH
jgi:hypothetical protein